MIESGRGDLDKGVDLDNGVELASGPSGTASDQPWRSTGGSDDDGVASAIASMWPAASERFRQRLAAIEDYVAEVALGNAESVDVTEAQNAAHKLAGTLGLFGLTNGSVLARELDERLDDHPHYDPETVERLAYLTNGVRSDLERRSRTSNTDPTPSPIGDGVVVVVGGDNSRSESIRWLLGGRGVEVEDIDGEALADLDPNPSGGIGSLIVSKLGPRRPRAVLVDLGDGLGFGLGVDTVDLVAGISASLTDCAIVVLAADDDLVTRKALLDAGASTVAGTGVDPGSAVQALLEDSGGSSRSTVVVVGVDRRRSELISCFDAHRIVVEMVDVLCELVPTLKRLEPMGPDAIVIGPDTGTHDTLDAGEVVTILHADPVWSRYPTIVVIESWADDSLPRSLSKLARADGLEVETDGWAAIAARLRQRLRRGVVGGVGRASSDAGLVHQLDTAWAMSRRDGYPFSVILLDPVESQDGADGEHRSGDGSVDAMEQRLRPVFRPGDALGSWIGGRLLVGFGAPPEVADHRLAECCRELARSGLTCRGSTATAPMDGEDLDSLLAVAGRRIRDDDGPESGSPDATRVLLVEDDPIVAEIVVELLHTQGHVVEVLTDGKAAVERVTSPHLPDEFDLVLLDITLPGIDGFGVLRAMKATANAGVVPVVVLSGRSHEDEVRTALKLGAADHVTKPFSPQVLLRRTERALALALR